MKDTAEETVTHHVRPIYVLVKNWTHSCIRSQKLPLMWASNPESFYDLLLIYATASFRPK